MTPAIVRLLQAHATVLNTRVHSAARSGLMICLDAEAIVQDCEITNNRSAGIAVHTGGRPSISGCDIHHNLGNGVYTSDHAQGIITGVITPIDETICTCPSDDTILVA